MDKYFVDYTKKDSKNILAVEENTNNYIYLHKLPEGGTFPKCENKYNFDLKEYVEIFKKYNIKYKDRLQILQKLEDYYFNDKNINEEQEENIRDLFEFAVENECKKFKADRKLIPVLKPNWFDCVYINGGSGAGKTNFLVKMVNAYLNSLPKKDKPEVFLISKKEKDEMIDKGIKGIKKIDPMTFLEEPMTVEELPLKCIVILDDYEGYKSDPKLFKLIYAFIDDIMTMGRTKLLKLFMISHLPSFGQQSTLTFIEASYFIFYPTRTNFSSLDYILKKKLGLDKESINKVKNMKRIIIQKYPKILLHDKIIQFF